MSIHPPWSPPCKTDLGAAVTGFEVIVRSGKWKMTAYMGVKMDDGLYPEIEPYETAFLERDGHQLYYELSGLPDGPTALFLHGGPGGGTSPRARRFFNPERYRIVLLDQRGAGQSMPNVSQDYDAALVNNTTPHLVGDIEALREASALSSGS